MRAGRGKYKQRGWLYGAQIWMIISHINVILSFVSVALATDGWDGAGAYCQYCLPVSPLSPRRTAASHTQSPGHQC